MEKEYVCKTCGILFKSKREYKNNIPKYCSNFCSSKKPIYDINNGVTLCKRCHYDIKKTNEYS